MTWLLDGRKLARKVKNATVGGTLSGFSNEQSRKTVGCSECHTCGQPIGQNATLQDWPGLPAGVKFDPNDNELLDHLSGKIGYGSSKQHPLIDEFIPTLSGEDGICYTHPQKLPGVKTDGSSCHFFHRPSNAYTTGTRKRRKVHTGSEQAKGETRWHKTGKTRPVLENGEQIGCKKIMVLYTNFGRKSKPEKTNWVMHQYHLGTQEEEKDGELVVSKVFYQTQPRHPCGLRKSPVPDEVDCETNEERSSPSSTYHQRPASASAFTENSISRETPATPQAEKQMRISKGKLSKLRRYFKGHGEKGPLLSTSEAPDSALQTSLPLSAAILNETWRQDIAEDHSPVSHWVAPCIASQPQLQSQVGTTNKELLSPDILNEISSPIEASSLTRQSSWINEQEVDKDMLALDAELMDLFCDEKLYADPIFYDTSFDDVAQNFRRYAADIGLLLDEDSGDSSRELTENPLKDTAAHAALEEILLDTPPDFVEDLVLTSQELVDWIGKRRFLSESDRQCSLDNHKSIKPLGDSQSSS